MYGAVLLIMLAMGLVLFCEPDGRLSDPPRELCHERVREATKEFLAAHPGAIVRAVCVELREEWPV